jgi:hypothetical protein
MSYSSIILNKERGFLCRFRVKELKCIFQLLNTVTVHQVIFSCNCSAPARMNLDACVSVRVIYYAKMIRTIPASTTPACHQPPNEDRIENANCLGRGFVGDLCL